MKKLSLLFIFVLLISLFVTPFSSVSADEAQITLKVCNCEDYIDEDICNEFEDYMAEKGKNVKVEYSTYGTNENLYNDLKIANGYLYDVICTSDYMIEKMAKEGMLKKIGLNANGNYNLYASPYIKDIFENKITWDGNKLSEYATAYMWGTLGLVYNPEIVLEEDMNSWLSLWKDEYKNKSTIKDSVRDSYFIGIAGAYKEELDALDKTALDYNAKLSEIFGRVDDETISKVELSLSSLKDNIFGFEVDSGKNDMVTGKISINFAWSGDAVYAMDQAEEDELYLNYAVPEEGSNIWFDGWCVPTHAKNIEVAKEFIEFLSSPYVAARNMEYVGYTSAIAGDSEFTIDYDGEEVTYSGILDWLKETYSLTEEPTEENVYSADLSYFFGKEIVLYSEEVGRQFSAQYPTEDVINRCVIMRAFSEERNTKINAMWENVKGQAFPMWTMLIVLVIIIIVALTILAYRNKDWLKERLIKSPRKQKPSKYKIISIEEIK